MNGLDLGNKKLDPEYDDSDLTLVTIPGWRNKLSQWNATVCSLRVYEIKASVSPAAR
jgi:hypothetical protein